MKWEGYSVIMKFCRVETIAWLDLKHQNTKHTLPFRAGLVMWFTAAQLPGLGISGQSVLSNWKA